VLHLSAFFIKPYSGKRIKSAKDERTLYSKTLLFRKDKDLSLTIFLVKQAEAELRQNNTDEPTRCNNDLLIYKISSTRFGQSFAHHQERVTEIFTAYGILLLWWAGRR